MSTEKPRFTITLDSELYERVNDYQHSQKYATQTKAISDLIMRGAKSLGLLPEDDVDVDTSDIDLTDTERDLVIAYRRADARARQMVNLALEPFVETSAPPVVRIAARGGGISEIPAKAADEATTHFVPAEDETL